MRYVTKMTNLVCHWNYIDGHKNQKLKTLLIHETGVRNHLSDKKSEPQQRTWSLCFELEKQKK